MTYYRLHRYRPSLTQDINPSLFATTMDMPDDEQLLALPFHIPLPRTSENTTNVSSFSLSPYLPLIADSPLI